MIERDSTHLSTCLHCLTASEDLEHALGPEGRDQLAKLLDLPAAYGGRVSSPLNPLQTKNSWNSLQGSLMHSSHFARKTELPLYIRIAEALESLEVASESG
jgi:hypothetical protein